MNLISHIAALVLIVGCLLWDFAPDLWRGLCWLARLAAVVMLWAIVIAMLGALLHIGWEIGRYSLELFARSH